jgi:Uma2 family endonuclease
MTAWNTQLMGENELDLTRTYTEDEYLALGETDIRHELVDWKLTVTPPPSLPHQNIARYLINSLEDAAWDAGFASTEAKEVRLFPGTIRIPDLLIGKLPWAPGGFDAADVVLVGEVTSPGNAKSDREEKREQYALARIPWYLLVEPDKFDLLSVSLRLLRLDGARYVDHAFARFGQILVSDEPFSIAVETTKLIRPLR